MRLVQKIRGMTLDVCRHEGTERDDSEALRPPVLEPGMRERVGDAPVPELRTRLSRNQ